MECGTCSVVRGYRVPIEHLPEGAQIFGPSVLVLEIISMFPNVHAKYRRPLYLCYIHQRVVLVWRRADLELAVFEDQPGPTAAKPAHRRGIEFFLEGVKTAKGRI